MRRICALVIVVAVAILIACPLMADTMIWNKNLPSADPIEATVGYIVHMGTAPHVYTTSIDVGNVDRWLLPTLNPTQRYYFAVSAYNVERTLSGPSAEVDYIASPPPQPLPCTFTLVGPTTPVAHGGGTGSIAIGALRSDCGWTAVSNQPWLTLSPASGTGSGQVGFDAAANTGVARQATITVGGATFVVQQAATPPTTCTDTTRPVVTVEPERGPYRPYTSLLTRGQAGRIHFVVSSPAKRPITSVYVEWEMATEKTRWGISGTDVSWVGGLQYRPTVTGTANLRVYAVDNTNCSGRTSGRTLTVQ